MTIQETNELQFFKERIIKLIEDKYNNDELLFDFKTEYIIMLEKFISIADKEK